MTLLTEVMQRPLDPGYAAAAAAKRSGSRVHRRPTVVLATVVLAALGGVTAGAAVRQLRTPQPEVVEARQDLEREIERRAAAADRLQTSNERLRALITEQQAAALAGGQGGAPARRSREQGALTGELGVTGPGILLTVDDAVGIADGAASDPRADTGFEQGRIQDRDLQIIVNGLWAAGAEALAVNGERLTALSAIRSAGQAILVGFRPLSPPYVLQVVGDPESLQSNFAADMGGQYLQTLSSNFGIRVRIEAQQSLTLPAAGSLSLHYAHRAGAGGTGSTSAPSSGAAVSGPADPEVSK